MTKYDKILWDLITTLKTWRPLEVHGFYMINYEKDLHTKGDLLFLENKTVKPAATWGSFRSILHQSHPGQFGMKFLAEFIWWPHIYWENYNHGKSIKQCSKAGKILRVLLESEHMSKYRSFIHDKWLI